MTTRSFFQDTSVDCAICLEPLDDHQDRDTNVTKPNVITLGCGHRWHLDCLRQQLETARPSSTRRLLFSGCQCAKCGSICEHEELEDLTRTTDTLRDRVDRLILEQLQQQIPSTKKGHSKDDDDDSVIIKLSKAWKEAKHNPKTEEKVLQEARRKFAFYLCAHCQEPYFGGTVDCFNADNDEREEETRMCVACTPQSQIVCRNPLDHGGALIWKCRYCCRPATIICYGNVHFCKDCHDRNGQQNTNNRRPMIAPIPCPGKECTYPKPPRIQDDNGGEQQQQERTSEFHSNGPDPDCEQVYACMHCQSTTSDQQEEEVGSRNLLQNPSGHQGLQGWRQLNRRMSWRVEESNLPVNASTTTNFVSSFHECVMSQQVNLSDATMDLQESFDTNNFRIQVSARYMARTDCPSVFKLEAALVSHLGARTIQHLATSVLDAPPDHWAKATLTLENVSLQEANILYIIIRGKDRRFWSGNYGSKVAECSVRVLY